MCSTCLTPGVKILSIKKEKYLLALVLLVGFCLRFFGLNWDQGYHLHPDERMIIMTTEGIRLPDTISLAKLLDKNSPLNPHFFAYGNLPLYLLKISAWLLSLVAGDIWRHYSHLVLVGRGLSVFFDLGTIWLIGKIGQKIFSPKIGLWAAFFYATCVFPIQQAHFYAVDTLLNFFLLLTLWGLICFYQKPGFKRAALVGISFGLALATKVSATVLIAAIGTALVIDLWLVFRKKIRQQIASWWKKLFLIFKGISWKKIFHKIFREILFWASIVAVFAGLTFVLTEPYALIDWQNFLNQIQAQRKMTQDAYTFPYTLQYVGTTPYLYQLKNLLFWGMGFGLGLLAILGSLFYLVDLGKRLLKKGDYDHEAKELIVLVFFLVYFLVVGQFAVKFLRYLLPLYPLAILYGVYLASRVKKKLNPRIFWGIACLFLTAHLLWLFAFLNIYRQPHSRVSASEWIHQNIPPGAILAVEHWDDRLPLYGAERYQFVEMPLYETDQAESKWQKITTNLEAADYLILASNRLYTPLQKLADCQKFKRCFPRTARYYQDLFSGQLDFVKVAEFTAYPMIPFLNLSIADDSADESFTVYDHPKVIIFGKQ